MLLEAVLALFLFHALHQGGSRFKLLESKNFVCVASVHIGRKRAVEYSSLLN